MYHDSGKRIPTADMIYDNINGLDFDAMARVLKKAQKERQFSHLVINGDGLGGNVRYVCRVQGWHSDCRVYRE